VSRKDRPDGIPEKDECIRQVMRLMQIPGAWVTGKTGIELAERWGLGLKTVEAYSAEASRRLRDSQFDKATAKVMLAEHLRFIAGLAMGQNGKGRELRTAVAAISELADILGIKGGDDLRPADMNMTIIAYPPEPIEQEAGGDADATTEPSAE